MNVPTRRTHALGHGGVAAAFELVVFILIQSLGETSGANLNPAVTVAFWTMGRFDGRRVLLYVLAPLADAALGSGLVQLIAPRAPTWGPRYRPTGPDRRWASKPSSRSGWCR